jgi:hypothetical protein
MNLERKKEQKGFLARRIWLNGRIVFITGNGFSISVWLFGNWNRIVVSRG